MTCPRCGSIEVDSTTMGGIIFPGAEAFDDANRSTCQKCHHKGSTGDWERLDKLRAALAAAEVKLAALVKAAEPFACDQGCDAVHHPVKDRHDQRDNCPVVARLRAAIAAAKSKPHSAGT